MLFDVPFGVCWACLATLVPVWASLLELVVVFLCFFLLKVWFCRFDATLERKCYICSPGSQVGGPGVQKSYRKPALATFWEPWRRSSAKRSVGVMEPGGNGRESAQNWIKAEGKVYLSDNEYD